MINVGVKYRHRPQITDTVGVEGYKPTNPMNPRVPRPHN